jgi:hypothetical protein
MIHKHIQVFSLHIVIRMDLKGLII